jgi:hypothetical protein
MMAVDDQACIADDKRRTNKASAGP